MERINPNRWQLPNETKMFSLGSNSGQDSICQLYYRLLAIHLAKMPKQMITGSLLAIW